MQVTRHTENLLLILNYLNSNLKNKQNGFWLFHAFLGVYKGIGALILLLCPIKMLDFINKKENVKATF